MHPFLLIRWLNRSGVAKTKETLPLHAFYLSTLLGNVHPLLSDSKLLVKLYTHSPPILDVNQTLIALATANRNYFVGTRLCDCFLHCFGVFLI
jgi:hypothetical protein